MYAIRSYYVIPSPLNYIGGKYKLLPQILPLFPNVSGTFVDLFCGGCNVGINVDCNKVIFNDTNSSLLYLLNTFKNLDKNELFKFIYEIIDKYQLSISSMHGYNYYHCESSKGLADYNREHFLKLREDFNKHTNEDYYYYVITSYSIHYTKLYDILSLKSLLPTGRLNFPLQLNLIWLLNEYTTVITSYSIHYTKLYDFTVLNRLLQIY